MFLNDDSLDLAKKILFIFCLVFAGQMTFPQVMIAHEINLKYGEGPKELAFINHPDNPDILKNSNSDFNISTAPSEDLPYYTMYTTITAYSSTVDQCDADPFTAAWGKHVYWGMVASNYLPRGTKIKIEGFGDKLFSIEDTMNQRYWNRIDIWMPNREQAKNFGVKYLEIKVYK